MSDQVRCERWEVCEHKDECVHVAGHKPHNVSQFMCYTVGRLIEMIPLPEEN